MIIEYGSIYTEFPAELLDAPGLLDALRDNALGWANTKRAELLEGPPQLLKQAESTRKALYNLYVLKWPALYVFFSVNDAESII